MMTRSRTKRLQALQSPQNPSPNNYQKNTHSRNDANSFDIPLEQTGRLEDQLFVDCIRFSNDNDLNIEGLTYEEIQRQPELRVYLDGLRNNLPGYFNLTGHQKVHYFQKRGEQYLKGLNMEGQDEKVNNSEGCEPVQKKSVRFTDEERFVVFDKEEMAKVVSEAKELREKVKK